MCTSVCVSERESEREGGLLCFTFVLRRLGSWHINPGLTSLLDLKFSLAGTGPLSCLSRDQPHPCMGPDADVSGGPLCPRKASPRDRGASWLHWRPGPSRAFLGGIGTKARPSRALPPDGLLATAQPRVVLGREPQFCKNCRIFALSLGP